MGLYSCKTQILGKTWATVIEFSSTVMILNLFWIIDLLEKAINSFPKKDTKFCTDKGARDCSKTAISYVQKSTDAKLRFPNAMPGSRMETATYSCCW